MPSCYWEASPCSAACGCGSACLARAASCASLVVIIGLSAGSARAADDGSVFHAIGKLFGYDPSQSSEHIDFRERPKLVVPPSRQSLPEPRAGEDRPASWPVEKSVTTRGGPRVTSSNADPDDPKRENLVQPPDGYRHATKDLTTWKDPDTKPSLLQKMGDLTKGIGFGGQ